MRGYEAVLCGEQRVVGADRLGSHRVETRPGELSGVQSLGERVFVDEGSAAVVYQYSSVFHFRDGAFVDDVLCLVSQRTVQRDNILGREQRIKVGVPKIIVLLIASVLIVSENLHSKGNRDPRRYSSDPSEPDDANSFVRELNRRIVPEAPVDIVLPASLMNGIGMVLYVMADL